MPLARRSRKILVCQRPFSLPQRWQAAGGPWIGGKVIRGLSAKNMIKYTLFARRSQALRVKFIIPLGAAHVRS